MTDEEAATDSAMAMTDEPGAAKDELAAGPSLHLMPEAVLGRIFQNMKADKDASALVSLEMTCTSLKSALASDVLWAQTLDNGRGDPEFLNEPEYEGLPTWREYALRRAGLKNIQKWQSFIGDIVFETMGGIGNGIGNIRALAETLLQRMNSSLDESVYKMCLRRDAISCLTESLQHHITTKFKKAFACAVFRSGPHFADPIVTAADFDFLSKLDNIGKDLTLDPTIHEFPRFGKEAVWNWPRNDCADAIDSTTFRRMIRRLAYRAGVCKMSSCAFEVATKDFLQTLSIVLVDAFEASKGLAPASVDEMVRTEDPRYITSDDTMTFSSDSEDSENEPSILPAYYEKFPPPFRTDISGKKIECVIIPRQVTDALSRCGLHSVYSDNSTEAGPIGTIWSYPSEENADDDSEDGAISQYYAEDDGDESVENMDVESGNDSSPVLEEAGISMDSDMVVNGNA